MPHFRRDLRTWTSIRSLRGDLRFALSEQVRYYRGATIGEIFRDRIFWSVCELKMRAAF